MNTKKVNNSIRTRDDSRWRALVSESRARRQALGLDDPELDWEKIIAEEAAAEHFVVAPTLKDFIMEQSELCFVLMPIGKPESEEHSHWLKIYENIIRPAIEGSKEVCRAVRCDEDGLTGNISANVVIPICKAKVVIADVTGTNPSVMYALGIAHCFAKRTLVICQKGTESPEMLKDIRIIQYEAERKDGGGSFKREFSEALQSAESSLKRLSNPVQAPLPDKLQGGIRTIAEKFEEESAWLQRYLNRSDDL